MFMLYRMLRDCNHGIYGKLHKGREYELTDKEVSGILRFVEPVEVREVPFPSEIQSDSSSLPAAPASQSKTQKRRGK